MEEIGETVRSLRTRARLSQRALARKANVSNGTISLIESGATDPTVGQLKKILGALDVSMAEFFQPNDEPQQKYFFSKEDFVEIGSGKISFRQIGHGKSSRLLQVISETYSPGADTGPSMLRHDGEEAGIILSGVLEVQVLDQRRILKAGDAYQFPSHLPHRFRNIGNRPCRLVSACTPPSF